VWPWPSLVLVRSYAVSPALIRLPANFKRFRPPQHKAPKFPG
jgi:hypothetical protein